MPDDQEYGGPWLLAAVFCEKVMFEKDNTATLIRLVDRFTMTASGAAPPVKMPPANIKVTAFLYFKAGIARGSFEVTLNAYSPSRKKLATMILPMLLEGEDRGSQMGVELNLQINEDGLYWVDVLLGERLVTRMPLRIVYQRIVSGPSLSLPAAQ